MDSGFLGAVVTATECRNEVQFMPLSWPRLATSSPPANGENAAHVVAQWRASRWAKTKWRKCRWTTQWHDSLKRPVAPVAAPPQSVGAGRVSWTPSDPKISPE
ncbi:hypothetical protein TcCL_ESM02480 [Trypanosoma cruzi]|nr:hypothetical protein TcCL_ESM02480 [Trypanosoma cruzi]